MNDCVTFHYDGARSGLGDGAKAESKWHKILSVPLGSAIRGAPLFIRNWQFNSGPHAGETHDMVYIATSDNNVCAYAEDQLLMKKRSAIWAIKVGSPVTNPPFPGHFSPTGIASTSVLDSANRLLFVCSCQTIARDAQGHEIFVYKMLALDMDSGEVRDGATLTGPAEPTQPKFDANQLDQRGALNLVDGRIYACFAAFRGDEAGEYYGWVVSCNASNLSDQLYFSSTKNVIGGGIWGPGGVASALDGSVYVATGNAPGADNNYWTKKLVGGQHPPDINDYFMAVVKLKAQATESGSRLTVMDWYQPTDARELNDSDRDLGSSSCLILPTNHGLGLGAPAMNLMVLSAKNAIYLLNADSLGKWGGEKWKEHVFDGGSHSAPAHYQTPGGDQYVYFSGGTGDPNQTGLPGLICFKVVADDGGATLIPVWRAGGGAGVRFLYSCGSPTIGSVTMPSPFALVWVAEAPEPPASGILHAYNALDGSEVYSSAGLTADDLGPVPHYPPVVCAGATVYVGTYYGFAIYRAQPDRIGVLQGNTLMVKEGDISGPWVPNVAEGVTAFALSGDRIGVLQGNTLMVKEGDISGPWVPNVAEGVTAFALPGV